MWICTYRSLRPRCLGSLLLSLLLMLSSPSVVQAAGKEVTAPDCALASQSVVVQLMRSAEQVQATLHSAPGDLPAAGCRVPLQFPIPEDARPSQAVWRDVKGRAVHIDGTPDPAHPNPLPLRLWIHPDGTLQYEVREAGLEAVHATLDLAVAWGTTPAANDLAVLDILGTALGLEEWSKPWDLKAQVDGTGRVWRVEWNARHPYETVGAEFRHTAWGGGSKPDPARGIRPPGVRRTWQLPSELGQLTQMRRLVLGGPLLTGTIPPELGRLTNLELLTLAGSRLTGSVPPELGRLTRLRTLELHHNRLTALPPELGRLNRLAHLSLAGNRLTALPAELGRLTQLEKLGLAGNRLTALPPELGRLTSLVGLGVAGNRLTALPPELARLPNLQALDVQDNQLAQLPPLNGLSSLGYLDLSGNRLATLPPGLLTHGSLLHLDVGDNQLKELPPEIFEPTISIISLADPFLQKLLREYQEARQLPDIQTVGVLRSLDLSGNQLTELPPILGLLRPHRLDLSDNQLSTLPPALGQLTHPVYHPLAAGISTTLALNLSGNRLTDLPPRLGRIPAWQLDLSDNLFTSLPEALFQMDRLHTLNLSGNRLATLPPELGQLLPLSSLDLSDNALALLPPEIGQLQGLRTLNLAGNELVALPPELGQLSQLALLGVSENRLATLPPELGRLRRLLSLDLSGNQVTDLPAPVVGQLLKALTGSGIPSRTFTHLTPHVFRSDSLDLNLYHSDSLDLGDNPLTALPAYPPSGAGMPPHELPRLRLSLAGLGLNDLNADLERMVQWPHQVIHLDLSHNQLTAAPSALALFHDLTHLDLSHNQLSDLSLDPDQLAHLTHLDLSHNRFSEIPPVLSQLHPLLSLDLRGNPLTTCPLPLPWHIDRYIYPPDYDHVEFDHWYLSPPRRTEHPDLPFLELCPE